MHVYLHPNPQKRDALLVAAMAATVLAEAGAGVLVDEAFKGQLQTTATSLCFLPQEKALGACDIVLTVGGDGTMLHVAGQAFGYQKPLLGVNTGRLGFLAVVERDELDKLRRLPKKDYHVERRSVLALYYGGQSAGFAMNDIVFLKNSPEKSISLNIHCDDVLVSSSRGDGVVFATPTGSTAYSMSAGGPIVDARLAGIVVTQICAHVVQTPPMVFAADRMLRVDVAGTEAVCVSCDGQPACLLPTGMPAIVRQHERTLPLVQFSDADQLKSIDKKLKGR